jgi:hypothetical protein
MDCFLFELLFMIVALAKTLDKEPTQADFARVLKAMGISMVFQASTPDAFLARVTKELVAAFRVHIVTKKDESPFVLPFIFGIHHLAQAMTALTPIITAFPYVNSSLMVRSRAIYIGPWTVENRGKGDCLAFALLHCLFSLKGRAHAMDKTIPLPPGIASALKLSNTQIISNMREVRDYCAQFFEDFTAPFGDDDNVVTFKVKEHQDGADVEVERTRRMTKGDFLYMNSESLGPKEDVNFGPGNAARIEWVAKKEWRIIATAGSSEFPGVAMMYAFMHKLKVPNALAVYTWNRTTNLLQRSGQNYSIVRDGVELVQAEADCLLAPHIWHSFTTTTALKSLGISLQRNPATWANAPRPLQNHFTIERNGQHFRCCFSALDMLLISQVMDVSDACPMYRA